MANINKIKLSGTTYSIQDENATKTVELTQAQYDALSVKDPNTFYIITDATAGDLSNYYTKLETDDLLDTKLDVSAYTPTDLSNYYTKSETSGATQISTALASKADTATTYTKTEVDNAVTAATSTKQDTLVSGTNIKTINNESILGSGNITIEGGGVTVDPSLDSGSTNPVANSAITTAINEKQNKLTVGIGISISQYNDTISLDVPIYKANDYRSCFIGQDYNYPNIVSGLYSFAVGLNNNVTGNYSLAVGGLDSYGEGNSATTINTFAFGRGNIAKSFCSTVVGYHNSSSNDYETDFGIYNNSVSASTTFGDSGNTLFSVGNGTSNSARHNAFEIRQNGDIYLTLDGQDVKLQDQLGGSSITVDPSLDSGSTNPVENRVIYNKIDEVEQVTAAALNELNETLSGKADSNSVYSKTEANVLLDGKLDVTAYTPTDLSNYYTKSETSGATQISTALDDKLDTSNFNTYTAATNSRLSEDEEVTAAGLNALNDAFGGLKLMKISQTDYENLQVKDQNTLYIVI